ncbi:MAG: META domain-containing protein [Prevotellaceae bacterium]|jgi:hypothetical protein|nr:META domain-containing protein [Prevotellaceae bacterium]
MKTKILLLIATLQVSVGGFTACNENKQEENITSDDELKVEKVSQQNLRQTWVLVAKKKSNAVENWQQDDPESPYPVTLTFDSTKFRGRHDANSYGGGYEMSGDTIFLSSIIIGTDLYTGIWYEDYRQMLTTNRISKAFLFSQYQDTGNMQLQLASQEITLYFINKKWFEEIYFKLEEWYNF